MSYCVFHSLNDVCFEHISIWIQNARPKKDLKNNVHSYLQPGNNCWSIPKSKRSAGFHCFLQKLMSGINNIFSLNPKINKVSKWSLQKYFGKMQKKKIKKKKITRLHIFLELFVSFHNKELRKQNGTALQSLTHQP